ncbi:MAG: hypothetical protein M3O50_07265 [Myxococcota bacterium]|nr:hypothetical protein [Myxococcota bacterium]
MMRAHISRHFKGAITPPAERAMREHLPTCDSCRELYGRHLLLNQLDPMSALSSEERIARGLGFHRRQSAGVVGRLALVAVAAAAAAALVVARSAPEVRGFTARGSIATPDQQSRVFVYDVRDGVPAPVGASLKNGDELAFAYVNGAGKRRLAIFGIDEDRHVYWFFPAWTEQSTDPTAIPIESDERRHELPEAIRHRFLGKHLEIHSVFVDQAITTRQIEALLEDDGGRALSIPHAVESSLSLEVTP